MMNDNGLYEAQRDDSAPFGWVALEGFYYRKDWGDELIQQDGKHYIRMARSHESTLKQLTLEDLQVLWGSAEEFDRLLDAQPDPETIALIHFLDGIVEHQKTAELLS